MEKKIAILVAIILVLVALVLFLSLGGFRLLGWHGPGARGGPFPNFGDENAGFGMARNALGLPADATNEQVLEALGLPENASQEEIRNALEQKGVAPWRGE